MRGHSVLTLVGHAERLLPAAIDRHLDVPPHPLNDILHDRPPSAVGWIEVVISDDALQARPAENLVAYRWQPVLDLVVDHLRQDLGRDPLRHHHDEGLGAIPFRNLAGHHDGDRKANDKWQHDQPLVLQQQP
jgi:hypothetical protein